MKVVFLEEVEGTASPGDVKNVANGFARNYLLPRKLAAPANDHYIAIANAKATKHARRQDRMDDEARKLLLPKVDGTALTMEVRVGEQGKLFGSVTARDIAEALQAKTGIEIQHQQILLGQALRDVGTEEVKVRLTRNVIATINVTVEAQGAEEEPEAAAAPPETTEGQPEPEPADAESPEEPEAAEPADTEAEDTTAEN